MQLPKYETAMQMLRDKRKDLDRNLFDVAEMVGLSDSQLNRMELGETSTSYQNVQQVWHVLQELEKPAQEPAKSMMVEDILWANTGETRANVSEKLKQNDFSQLPVRDSGDAIGFVTDFDLMEHPDSEAPVEEIMGKSALFVNPTDSRKLVKTILEEDYPAVLVRDGSQYEGIITKFDLL